MSQDREHRAHFNGRMNKMDNQSYPSNGRKPMPDSVFPVAQPQGEASQ